MMPDQTDSMKMNSNGIFITKKQASITTALLVLLGLLIFIAGYFWGKQSMLDGFTQKTSQESFNDQVDYLLTMQSFAAKHGALPEDASEEQQVAQDTAAENDVAALLKNIPDALEESGKQEQSEPTMKTFVVEKPVKETVATQDVVPSATGKHFAALAGFAKKASAVTMINRLKKYKIDLELKTKVSKSASGKSTKTWYQVVTKKYDTKDEVASVVDRVVSIEHIKRKDIKIV